MSFKANLLKKIEIKQLARGIRAILQAAQSGQRINIDDTRRLLGFSGYRRQEVRDLELYLMPEGQILVLDNDLPIYNTSIEDVALRKSPTIKEMVSIRNAIKILNDAKVIVSKKADSLETVVNHCIDTLDLSYQPDDIDQIRREGVVSLENDDADGVVQAMDLLAELLGYLPPPPAFALKHHHVAGAHGATPTGKKTFGPLVCYFAGGPRLYLMDTALEIAKPEDIDSFKQVADGEKPPSAEGTAVFRFLQEHLPPSHTSKR